MMNSPLKQLRQKKGLTQSDLAKALGVAQGTLSGWENEKYEIDKANLIKLSNIFNVSTDYLLGMENNARNAENNNAMRTFTSEDEALKFALFGENEEITDAQFEEVKQFAKFVKERDKRDKK